MDNWNMIIAICAIGAFILSIINSIILYYHNKRIAEAQEKTAESTERIAELGEREFKQKSEVLLKLEIEKISPFDPGSKFQMKITNEGAKIIFLELLKAKAEKGDLPTLKLMSKRLLPGKTESSKYTISRPYTSYDNIIFTIRYKKADNTGNSKRWLLDIKNSPSKPKLYPMD
jgi:hypothetical protein